MKTNILKFFVVISAVSLILLSCTEGALLMILIDKNKSEIVEPENTQPMSYLFGGSVSYGANNRLNINNLGDSPLNKQIPFGGAYFAVSYKKISGFNYKFDNYLKIGQINLNNLTTTSTILGDTSKVEILITALESEIDVGTYPIYDIATPALLKSINRTIVGNPLYEKVTQQLNTTAATAVYSRNIFYNNYNASTILGISGFVTINSYDKKNQFVSGSYSITQSMGTRNSAYVVDIKEGYFRNLYVQKF
jgi:hypothetical protein